MKKRVKHKKKKFPKKKNNNLPFFYAAFQCGRCNFFKNLFLFFFAHENIKKLPSKVAHNRPQTFFSSTGPAAQTSPELIFHIINMSQDPSVSLSVVLSQHFSLDI